MITLVAWGWRRALLIIGLQGAVEWSGEKIGLVDERGGVMIT